MSKYCIDDNAKAFLDDFDLEKDDPSLNDQNEHSLRNEYHISADEFNRLFLSRYGIEYITSFFYKRGLEFRVVSHPYKTNTCYEKALMLGKWDPLNVIKALYFGSSKDDLLYVAVVPETGCFMDKTHLKATFELPDEDYLVKAKHLPAKMTYGTCSPFIEHGELTNNGGVVKKIYFDTESLINKKHDNTLDDFSFGLDHRFSVQMNYYQCYRILKSNFGNAIDDREILTLSFKEKFVRMKGNIKINYEFKTLNYRTAKFINSIHGYGDVSIENDHVDELDLPDILTTSNGHDNSS